MQCEFTRSDNNDNLSLSLESLLIEITNLTPVSPVKYLIRVHTIIRRWSFIRSNFPDVMIILKQTGRRQISWFPTSLFLYKGREPRKGQTCALHSTFTTIISQTLTLFHSETI